MLADKNIPTSTKLVTKDLAEAALKMHVESIQYNIKKATLNKSRDKELVIPDLFPKYVKLHSTNPVYNNSIIQYWVSIFQIELDTGLNHDVGSKGILDGEYIYVQYTETEIVNFEYKFLPVSSMSLVCDAFASPKNLSTDKLTQSSNERTMTLSKL